MKHMTRTIRLTLAGLLGAFSSAGCGETVLPDETVPMGALHLYVNGEDLARDGFTAKDGWALTFEHAYIHLHGPTAYQVAVEEDETAAAPLLPQHAGHPHVELGESLAHVALLGNYLVDLAAGDGPTRLGTVDAPIGNYNYLLVEVTPADADSHGGIDEFWGQSLVLMGAAVSADTTLPFTLRFDETLTFAECGPVADDTGVVSEGGEGFVEFTFHLDHLFGDEDLYGTDEAGLNDQALGFAPFAALAVGDAVDLYQSDLAAGWDAERMDQLLAALRGLGHAGEAHCGE